MGSLTLYIFHHAFKRQICARTLCSPNLKPNLTQSDYILSMKWQIVPDGSLASKRTRLTSLNLRVL